MNTTAAIDLHRWATDAGPRDALRGAPLSPRAEAWTVPLRRSAGLGARGPNAPSGALLGTWSRTSDPQPIWDGGHRCFNAGALREAMLVRGLSTDELAAAAGVARATLYNVLRGRPTRLRTARRLLDVLAGVEPTLRLRSLTED